MQRQGAADRRFASLGQTSESGGTAIASRIAQTVSTSASGTMKAREKLKLFSGREAGLSSKTVASRTLSFSRFAGRLERRTRGFAPPIIVKSELLDNHSHEYPLTDPHA